MEKTYVLDTRFHNMITQVFRAIMIISIILAIWNLDIVWVGGIVFGLFISFFPSIITKDLRRTLPWMFDFLIAMIALLHSGGRMLEYYVTIPGYQLLTQFFIAILVAFLSLTVIYILDEHWDGLIMDTRAMAFVTVICTMAFGVFLEFIKWANISGTLYEKTNQALMLNLSVNTLAGIIISFVGVTLIKKGMFHRITDEFGNEIDEAFIHPNHHKKR